MLKAFKVLSLSAEPGAGPVLIVYIKVYMIYNIYVYICSDKKVKKYWPSCSSHFMKSMNHLVNNSTSPQFACVDYIFDFPLNLLVRTIV